MSFAYYDPANVEFGVCRGTVSPKNCVIVPVDNTVKTVLEEMVASTRSGMGLDDETNVLVIYEASQQHGAEESLLLKLDDPLGERLRVLYEHENLPTEPGVFRDPRQVTAYFCIIHDRDGNKLLAIKRAAQFKAVLKAHLIQFFDGTLKALTDDVFKLDFDFDVFVADGLVYIRRPAAFEQLAGIDEQVLACAAESALQLGVSMPFIDFTDLAYYASGHKRAARLIAALRSRVDLGATSTSHLRRECRRNGIVIVEQDGKLSPKRGHELAFLQMLDRRRYTLSLVPRRWEQYEASSRKEVGVREREPIQVEPKPISRARGRNGGKAVKTENVRQITMRKSKPS